MANWTDLPADITTKISEHLDFYEDVENFAKVCSSWRQSLVYSNRCQPAKQTPWLMLAERDSDVSNRRFYSLYNGMVREINLPPVDKSQGNWRYFSSNGWMFSVTQKGLKITLFDPFAAGHSNFYVVVQLPDIPTTSEFVKKQLEHGYDEPYLTLFHKFTVSKRLATALDDDYAVAMIYGKHQLAFWRCGDDKWTLVEESLQELHFTDVTHYQGEFYAVDEYGKVMAFGEGTPLGAARLVLDKQYELTGLDKTYLVESAGTLLFVRRYTENDFTSVFRVWELSVGDGKIKEVHTLDNRAIFIGFNSSFSVEASSYGCMPNCIYYNDDIEDIFISNYPLGAGVHLGVYDLTTKERIEDHYDGPSRFSRSTTPLWVECPLRFRSIV